MKLVSKQLWQEPRATRSQVLLMVDTLTREIVDLGNSARQAEEWAKNHWYRQKQKMDELQVIRDTYSDVL
jgi:hypothetical protein